MQKVVQFKRKKGSADIGATLTLPVEEADQLIAEGFAQEVDLSVNEAPAPSTKKSKKGE